MLQLVLEKVNNMSNINKLIKAKKQYDELEAIRLKASNLMVNEKYDACVHLHYDNKIGISCNTKDNMNCVWAQFDLIDGEITVTARGNYNDTEIDGMVMFIESWLEA